ncbi:MAG TPA: response regulator [Verrucomicrobiae bacterium]|jgi:CheY-like chemotaxis protein|nr:response regulator [Verrucomicrobiae bacterium]
MKKRVLLVEDHQDIIDLMTLELDILGYEVTLARDGLEAVKMATSEPFDVIILDILLPKLDGFEAAARIRAHPRTHNTPILAATALYRDKDRARCLASGCNDHIAKPFTHRQLQARLDDLLKDA